MKRLPKHSAVLSLFNPQVPDSIALTNLYSWFGSGGFWLRDPALPQHWTCLLSILIAHVCMCQAVTDEYWTFGSGIFWTPKLLVPHSDYRNVVKFEWLSCSWIVTRTLKPLKQHKLYQLRYWHFKCFKDKTKRWKRYENLLIQSQNLSQNIPCLEPIWNRTAM